MTGSHPRPGVRPGAQAHPGSGDLAGARRWGTGPGGPRRAAGDGPATGGGGGFDAHAEGQGRVYQGQTQNFYQWPGHSRAGAVVVPVVAPEAASGSVFVGREAQVGQLVGLLGPSAAVGTVAVAGMAGVGKSALARHAASVAVGHGWFAGGAVFTDLHGYDTEAQVIPAQVYVPVLTALGVPAERIPAAPEQHAAAYHRELTALAELGRPALLVLDNASHLDQVSDLLPRHRAHRVLVTSRHTLGDLARVRVLDLGVMAEADAVAVLDAALRARDPRDRRIADDPAGAADLARLCGRLPLALRFAASLLADEPLRPLADLAAELADAGTRLDTLSYAERSVRATFDLSVRHLEPAAARLFRLLPMDCGTEVSTAAATALAGEPEGRVRQQLRALGRAHLIEPGTAAGRWRMHDLVRLYATGLADVEPGERRGALDRLIGYYVDTAAGADTWLRAGRGASGSDRFGDRDAALAWLEAERPNLVAAVGLAAGTGRADLAVRLVSVLAGFLVRGRHYDDYLAAATTALTAAQVGGDRRLEGHALAHRGLALFEARRSDEAITVLDQAAAALREVGDPAGEAAALGNRASALRELRRFDEAIPAHEQDLAVHRGLGDRVGEAVALGNLGLALREVGRFAEAVAAQEQAATIFADVGDRAGEGAAVGNLGTALLAVGRTNEAVAAHRRSAAILAELGDRTGEATALNNLGEVLCGAGRYDEAIGCGERSVELHRQAGDPRGQGVACDTLAGVLAAAGRLDEAVAAHERAVSLLRAAGDRYREGVALTNFGHTLELVGRGEEAGGCWRLAVAAFTEVGAEADAERARGFLAAPP